MKSYQGDEYHKSGFFRHTTLGISNKPLCILGIQKQWRLLISSLFKWFKLKGGKWLKDIRSMLDSNHISYQTHKHLLRKKFMLLQESFKFGHLWVGIQAMCNSTLRESYPTDEVLKNWSPNCDLFSYSCIDTTCFQSFLAGNVQPVTTKLKDKSWEYCFSHGCFT